MLGAKIQKLRQARNLSLTQLAEKTEISKSYLSYIERNIQTNPSLEVLAKIAAALKVDIQTIISQEDPIPAASSRKVQVLDWSDFIKTALESGLIDQADLQEISLALQKNNKNLNNK